MFKSLLPFLTLTGLALYAQAATPVAPVTAPQVAASKSVVITALPYTISRPGTYVLLGNVQIPSAYLNLPAITINAPGKVILNLNNFAVIGYNWSVGLGMLIYSNDVTIENGTILNFEDAVDVNPYSVDGVPPASYLTGFKVHNVSFVNIYDIAIGLNKVNGADVSECSFSGGQEYFSISDTDTSTGNKYSNLSFDTDTGTPISVSTNVPLFLKKVTFTPAKVPGG
jgi:hypothetical protein